MEKDIESSYSNISEENLACDYLENTMMKVSLYEEGRKLYSSTKKPKKSSIQTIINIKVNIRDAALEDLVELAEISNKIPLSKLPELSPERKAAIAKAKFEIHRRAFKNFIVVPSRKFNGAELGTLRKPKH